MDSIRQTLIRQHARILYPYWLPSQLGSGDNASLTEYGCGHVRCIEADFGTSGKSVEIEIVRESRSDLKLFLSPTPAARVWHIVGRRHALGQTIYVASDGRDRVYVWYRGPYGYQVAARSPKEGWEFVKALAPLGREWIASLPNAGKLVIYATGPYASAPKFTVDYTLGWSPDGNDYPDIEGYVPVPGSGSFSDSGSYADSNGNSVSYSLTGTLSWNASVIQGSFHATADTGGSVSTTWQANRVG